MVNIDTQSGESTEMTFHQNSNLFPNNTLKLMQFDSGDVDDDDDDDEFVSVV